MELLIIGDVTEDLSDWAKNNYQNSQLLTNNNFDTIESTVCYTSVADLNFANLSKILQSVNRVIFHPPSKWSSVDIERQTILILHHSNRTIENFDFDQDPNKMLRLVDTRISAAEQLWIVGCSMADGFGIEKNQRYGQLVADQLDLPVSFLTLVATGIPWSADQILRSSLKPNDIIVWGLTGINRYSSYKNKIETHVISNLFDDLHNRNLCRYSVETRPPVLEIQEEFDKNLNMLTGKDISQITSKLLDEDLLLYAIKAIYQVINICEILGIKLVLFAHPMSTNEFNTILMRYLFNRKEFLELDPWVDKGKDGSHPGPKTNKIWAQQILNKIRQL